MTNANTQLENILKLTKELSAAEGEYSEAKAIVSELWKEYWPASEAKKAAAARRKAAKAAVDAALENAPELKALIKSIA